MADAGNAGTAVKGGFMPKQDIAASVAENAPAAPGFYRMRVRAPGLVFKPGQFFMISVPGHALRRAFAPSHNDAEGFSFTYQLVGEGTRELSTLPAGTEARVLAPLGNGYGLDGLDPRRHAPVLLGGGCGAPSLVLLAKTLRERGFTVRAVFGARTAGALLSADEMAANCSAFTAATDDGSAGFHGNSVDAARALCREIAETPVLFACGPKPMLKALAAWAAADGLACQVSLEERMGCGFGACMGCAVKLKADDGREFIHGRVCHDGPVFDSGRVIWE